MKLEILTAEQLAEKLGCEPAHINSLASNYQLPAIRYGRSWRFPIAALNAYFKKQATMHLDAQNSAAPAVSKRPRGRRPKPPIDLTKTVQVAVPLPSGGSKRIL